jgi:hypothetical protein
LGGLVLLVLVWAGIQVGLWARAERAETLLRDVVMPGLDAEVSFARVELSVWAHFPELSIQLHAPVVRGRREFGRDTLLHGRRLDITLSLWDWAFGPGRTLQEVHLYDGALNLKRLRDGTANWVIRKPDSLSTRSLQTELQTLNHLALHNCLFGYEDRRADLELRTLRGDLRLSGALLAASPYAKLRWQADTASLRLAGQTLLDHGRWQADGKLSWSPDARSLRLQPLEITLNELPLLLTGQGQLLQQGVDLSLEMSANTARFSSLLSVLPGMFTDRDRFAALESQGQFELRLKLVGLWTDESAPQIDFRLRVREGWFRFDYLPDPIQNVAVELDIRNPGGPWHLTEFTLGQLAADLGDNPLRAKGFWKPQANDVQVKADISAKINLETLTTILPIDDHLLEGILMLEADVAGFVSDSTLPKITALADLKYGYLKSRTFPAVLDNVTLSLRVRNTTGRLDDTEINLENLHAELDGEALNARLMISELADPLYNLLVQGKVDLTKLGRILPMGQSELTGLAEIDLQTRGRLSNVLRHADVDSTGYFKLSGFKWQAPTSRLVTRISNCRILFTATALRLQDLDGKYGPTDFRVQGELLNPYGYVMRGDTLRGNLQVVSRKIDLNPILADRQAYDPTPLTIADQVFRAVELPARLDLALAARADVLYFDDLIFQQVQSQVLLKNRSLQWVNASFALLGGRFKSDGRYDSQDPTAPRLELDLRADSLDIATFYPYFEILRHYAPITADCRGRFDLRTYLAMQLNQALDPVWPTLSGETQVVLHNWRLERSPVLEAIGLTTQAEALQPLIWPLQEVAFSFGDGRLALQPLLFRAGENALRITGGANPDGSLDYRVMVNTPTGPLEGQKAQHLMRLTNTELLMPQYLLLDLQVTGPYTSPYVAIAQEMEQTLVAPKPKPVEVNTDSILRAAQLEIERRRQELEDAARQEQERLRQEVLKQAAQQVTDLQNEINLIKQKLKGLPKNQQVKHEQQIQQKEAEIQAIRKAHNF